MNTQDEKYTKFALTREMLETASVADNFNPACTAGVADKIAAAGRLMLTGEGSSRIFPDDTIMLGPGEERPDGCLEPVRSPRSSDGFQSGRSDDLFALRPDDEGGHRVDGARSGVPTAVS